MSNRTETLKLIISGDGRLLGTELGKTESQVKQWGGRVGGVFSSIGKRISSSVKSIISNPLSIVGGTAGVMYAAKQGCILNYTNSIIITITNRRLSNAY